MSVDWGATGEGAAAFLLGGYAWVQSKRNKETKKHVEQIAENTGRAIENTSKVANGWTGNVDKRLDRILANQDLQGQQLAMLNERSESDHERLERVEDAQQQHLRDHIPWPRAASD